MQVEPLTVAPDINETVHVSTPWPGATSTVAVPWHGVTVHPHVHAVGPMVGVPEKTW